MASRVQTNTKNLYCRDSRANELITILGRNPFRQGRGFTIRQCPYGVECKGAHRKEEIQFYPHITKWNSLNKETFNFTELYTEIINVINEDKLKIKGNKDDLEEIDPKDGTVLRTIKIQDRMANINELNFFELVSLWHDLACYYQRLAKNIPKKNQNTIERVHTSGYKYSEEVPKFHLSSINEDYCWALVRTIKLCEHHRIFKEKVLNTRESVTIWDICLGDKNCKEGVHNTYEMLCTDDFLTGKCNCISKEEYDNKKELMTNELTQLTENLSTATRENAINNLNRRINIIQNQIINYQRKVHFTDKNMIPFDIQLDKFKAEKQAQEKIIKETEERLANVEIGTIKKLTLKKKK